MRASRLLAHQLLLARSSLQRERLFVAPCSVRRYLSSDFHGDSQWRVLQDETDLLLCSSHADTVVDILQRWQSHPDPNKAAMACDLLLQHWLNRHEENSSRMTRTAEPFLLSLKAWNRVGSGLRAAQVLNQWYDLFEGDLELEPTLEAFHLILETFAKEGGPVAQDESISIVSYLERMQSMGNLYLQKPNVETYCYVLQCLTRATQEASAQHWNHIASMLEQVDASFQDNPKDVYYRLQSYSYVICFAISMDMLKEGLTLLPALNPTQELSRAYSFWESQQQSHENNGVVNPTQIVGVAYQSVLSKLLRHRERTAEQMDTLLVQLQELPMEYGLPWPQHYKMVIEAWSNTIPKKPNKPLQVASHCEELLRQMEDRHWESPSKAFPLQIYERVIWMNYMRGVPAESLLMHVMKMRKEHPSKLITSSKGHLTAAWNHVFRASFDRNQSDRVVALWRLMQNHNVDANVATFTILLKALSRSKEPSAPVQAQEILSELQKNDTASASHYAAVMVAWSRSSDKNAAEKAQIVLEELERAHDSSASDGSRRKELHLTSSMYNSVIMAWARSHHTGAAEKAKGVLEHMKRRAKVNGDAPKPDVITYNAMIDVLSRQRNVHAAEEAESLLSYLESESDPTLRPQRMSYTAVMSAWVRSGARYTPERVMAIYAKLRRASAEAIDGSDSSSLRPDEVTYGIVLDMWSRSKRDDAGTRAEEILRAMQEEHLHVNVRNFNNVILAHARSKHAMSFDHAEALLREMQERYEAGEKALKPNTVTYTNVIQALKRSRVKDKADKAWSLLQEMRNARDEDVGPNLITYNSFLTSCAFTVGDNKETRDRALQLALAAMAEMEKDEVAPSSNTFALLLESIGRQVLDVSERTRIANVALNRCRKEGLIDSDVLHVLRKYTPTLCDMSPEEASSDDTNVVVDRRNQ